MSSLNKPKVPALALTTLTHGGATTLAMGPETVLHRSVLACLLWEDVAYEDGMSVAQRIASLVGQCRPAFVAGLAVTARETMKLRHVPLLLVREMARTPTHKALVAQTLERVIQRADEITEFLAIYWKDGRQPLSAQVKKGLSAAFRKFSEEDFAKYDRDGTVKLRDALFLCHAKPVDARGKFTKFERQRKDVNWTLKPSEKLYKKIVEHSLEVPQTWEVMLSAGEDKKAVFTQLMLERRLGGLAFLRNLRNMQQAGVDAGLVEAYMGHANFSRVLPFRFIAAAKACPAWEPMIERGMLRALGNAPKLPGSTLLIVDTSGSMRTRLSTNSEMQRIDAAASLTLLARELCEEVRIFCTAGSDGRLTHATQEIPPRRGFALSDLITGPEVSGLIGVGGIFLKQCMEFLAYHTGPRNRFDRVIVFTDEQDCDLGDENSPDRARLLGKHNYIINVSTNANGIGYKKWTHINGWSEAVLDYIRISEAEMSKHA